MAPSFGCPRTCCKWSTGHPEAFTSLSLIAAVNSPSSPLETCSQFDKPRSWCSDSLGASNPSVVANPWPQAGHGTDDAKPFHQRPWGAPFLPETSEGYELKLLKANSETPHLDNLLAIGPGTRRCWTGFSIVCRTKQPPLLWTCALVLWHDGAASWLEPLMTLKHVLGRLMTAICCRIILRLRPWCRPLGQSLSCVPILAQAFIKDQTICLFGATTIDIPAPWRHPAVSSRPRQGGPRHFMYCYGKFLWVKIKIIKFNQFMVWSWLNKKWKLNWNEN